MKFPQLPKRNVEAFTFDIAFGGDGAPGAGLTFLLSFINVGRRVVSSSDNFLIFGGDYKNEESNFVRRFIVKFIHDMKWLEGQTFMVWDGLENRKGEFHLRELPNDMKYLCFLAGKYCILALLFLICMDCEFFIQ